MKTLKPVISVLVMPRRHCMYLVFLLSGLLACIGPDHGPRPIRIKRFQWYETVYHAKYNASGKLVKMQAADRDVVFLYDENNKLYKAEANIYGQPAARLVYTYKHGPYGITEIALHTAPSNGDLSHPVNIKKFQYLAATKFESYRDISLEYDENDSSHISFQMNRLFVYNGDNVVRLHEIPVFTDYRATEYDNKINPFRILAEAVGNPAFFPVGEFINFPVVTFNIPAISIFSKNNPVKAMYWIEEAPITTVNQTFTYTYDKHGLVKNILWVATDMFSNEYTRTFAFEYEWGPAL